MKNDVTLTLFGHQLLDQKMTLAESLSFLHERDLINIGALAEQAVAKKVNQPVASNCNRGYDIENLWWEIKHGQARLNRDWTVQSAWVAGLKNKTGDIRVIITNVQEQQFFFIVPYLAYKDYKNSSLQWRFEPDGTPRRKFIREGRHRPMFWDFEVDSFNALCAH